MRRSLLFMLTLFTGLACVCTNNIPGREEVEAVATIAEARETVESVLEDIENSEEFAEQAVATAEAAADELGVDEVVADNVPGPDSFESYRTTLLELSEVANGNRISDVTMNDDGEIHVAVANSEFELTQDIFTAIITLQRATFEYTSLVIDVEDGESYTYLRETVDGIGVTDLFDIVGKADAP